MRKQRKSIPKRLLCFALSAVLLLGILPMGVLAAPDSTAAAETVPMTLTAPRRTMRF